MWYIDPAQFTREPGTNSRRNQAIASAQFVVARLSRVSPFLRVIILRAFLTASYVLQHPRRFYPHPTQRNTSSPSIL